MDSFKDLLYFYLISIIVKTFFFFFKYFLDSAFEFVCSKRVKKKHMNDSSRRIDKERMRNMIRVRNDKSRKREGGAEVELETELINDCVKRN